jgi:hypothetical protein
MVCASFVDEGAPPRKRGEELGSFEVGCSHEGVTSGRDKPCVGAPDLCVGYAIDFDRVRCLFASE